MDLMFLVNGLGFGVMVSAPLGPLGVLCIQRTINKGFLSGFVSGFGAAMADIIYASIAGFGISIIADFLEAQQLIIRALGGIILIILGYMIFMSNPVNQLRRHKSKKSSYLGDFVSSFFITITNPLTVVVFGVAFTSVGLNEGNSLQSVVLILTGVFVGALFWWIGLTFLVNIFRSKIRLRNLWWINKITGVMVAIFGLAVFISIFFGKTSQLIH
ncbi:MAG: LysE family transporter [Chloroflexia bacterium]|nr:LysE family transporter [Chloroflexia bacterium]